MSKVLILDANHRSALAATRSLGAKGIWVVVADEISKTLAGASRFCKESFVYTSPYTAPEHFITDIQRESRRRGIDIILPMTEISTYLVLKHSQDFRNISLPFVNFETFDSFNNKASLFRIAQNININISKTYFVYKQEDLVDVYPKLSFPIVLKPYQSRILLDNHWVNASVKYASSISDIEKNIEQYEFFRQHPFLLQEYIHGTGQGLFALYDHGRPLAFFAHKRLREKPPSGGVSVLSESVSVDPRIYALGRKLLDHAKWHGVAMVEFKVTPDGTPYLMEVNARFWGSLQLAIDAGVDFPWLLYQLATGKSPEQISHYRVGMRNRWLLGDWVALCMLLLNHKTTTTATHSEKLRSILEFLRFVQPNMRYEINRWNDLGPCLRELQYYLWRGEKEAQV